jgi:uncharacterized membrane protein
MDYLLISLLLLGVILSISLILVLFKAKRKTTGKSKETNYKGLFVMGISFIGMGTAMTATINEGFLGITALGIIYMLVGLKNKDKWTKSN